MGVSTKGAFYSSNSIDFVKKEVTEALKKEFGNLILDSKLEDEKYGFIFRLTLDFDNNHFEDNLEHRIVHFFNDGYSDYRIDTGCWGHSDRIVKSIINHFGGTVDYNDCDNINIDYCVSQPDSSLWKNTISKMTVN